jgi:hypothetical protein
VANYPGTTIFFSSKVDGTDTVVAADVNSAYDEIKAISVELGLEPRLRTAGAWAAITSSSAWTDPVGATPATVKLRLDNIELGVRIATNNLVNKFGGSTITPSATTVVGLKLAAITSQTANLIEFSAPGSATAVTYVTPAGTLVANDLDGGGA